MTRATAHRAASRAVPAGRRALVGLGLLLLVSSALRAQEARPCPRSTGRLLEQGWRLLRADSAEQGARRFAAALSDCPASVDAMVGLGFATLRRGDAVRAESLFVDVTRRAPNAVDAWDGLGAARLRQEQPDAARAAWLRTVELLPTHEGARASLARLDPDWERRRRPLIRRRAATLDVTMRVWESRFEMRRAGRWQPFVIRGVSLVPALPGRWPAEAPTDSTTYAGWIEQIGAMRANTIRTHTLLPPAFYRALRGHNVRNPARPVLLLQGLPLDLPAPALLPDSAADAASTTTLRAVVDALHGAADVPARPGHAGGWYDADVSPWSIGYLLGESWDPSIIRALDATPGAPRRLDGRHLTVADGTPTLVWLATQADRILTYEEATYHAQRPIAIANTPATDPIDHPTELSAAAAARFRGQDAAAVMGFTDETVRLVPTLVRRTPRNLAGWFASADVRPTAADFLWHDPEYARARSRFGPSSTFGYLQDLRRAHTGLPLLVTDLGVSSARGRTRVHPQGSHHGGLSETEQAEQLVRLDREAREAGAAGTVIASWIDEWFRPNRYAADGRPTDARAPAWLDVMNPETQTGLVALRPGTPQGPILGGDADAWRRLPVVLRDAADATRLRLGADAGYLYVALETDVWRGRPIDWTRERLQIALDTHRDDAGEFLLPTSGLEATVGFEFLLEFDGPEDAQLRVTPDYNRFTPARLVQSGPLLGVPFRRGVRTVPRRDAAFDTLYVMTNPPRFRPDGSLIPAVGVNAGRLRFGRAADHSLADWWIDVAAGMVQVRLPWALLNVTDPATRQVRADVASDGATPAVRGTESTPGLRAAAVVWSPGPTVRWTLPTRAADGMLRFDGITPWAWPTWQTPAWHAQPKPAYGALQRAWALP